MRARILPHKSVNLPLYAWEREEIREAAESAGVSVSAWIADAVIRGLSCGELPPRNYGAGDQKLFIELPAEHVREIRRRAGKVIHFIRWAISRRLPARA